VGGILAVVNELTREPIEKAKAAKLENAIKEMVPEFDNSPSEEAYYAKINEGDSLKIYPAKKAGQLVGVAIESNSMNGFGGEIKIIAGFNPEGKVINYAVLQHAETPGLGDKMGLWFKTDKNKQSILGKDLSSGELKVNKDGGDVDAITAATISSRAFLNAVNRAYAAFSGRVDAASGAGNPADASSSATTQQDGDGTTSATTSNDNNND
jgi:electron transport complex protein RnfG